MKELAQEAPREHFLPKMFSPEDLAAYIRRGYIPYTLHGDSFVFLLTEAKIYSFSAALTQINEYSDFTEVFIHPDRIYVPETTGKNFFDAGSIIRSKRDNLPGLRRIGSLTDYIQIALLHERRTGEKLFTEWTLTSTMNKGLALEELMFRSTSNGIQVEPTSMLKPSESVKSAIFYVPFSRS